MFIILIVQNVFQLHLILTLTKNVLQVNSNTKFSIQLQLKKKINRGNHSFLLLKN